MVKMRVGEQDAADRPAVLTGHPQDALGRTGEAGINQRETVLFPHQKTIERYEAREL